MKEREVLSTRELNRALLARQLLLKRSSTPLVRALEQVGGLQSQYAPSAYIGLWSRLEDFQRPHLTAALEKRRAVQGTLMRSTIHTVSAADFPVLAAGKARPGRRAHATPALSCPLVFNTKTPHSVPTFLIDGAVAGKWRYESGRVLLEPFDPIPPNPRNELEEEARALAAFYAA